MLKTLLVPLNGSARDRAALETAFLAGQPFSAHLDCVHVPPQVSDLIGQAALSDYDGQGYAAAAAALSRPDQRSREAAQHARDNFEAFCREHAVERASAPPAAFTSAEFRQLSGRWTDMITSEALCHDVMVLARGEDLSADNAGDVLLHSGRPVLFAAKEPRSYPLRTIAIAWKDRPEAARAVSAAMPLIARARRVVVLIGNENDDDTAATCLDCADRTVNQLLWHGIRAESRYVVPEGRSLPDAVLDSAAEVSADLVVAGAYARGRPMELVFGGFTRRVLDGTAIPVLMAH